MRFLSLASVCSLTLLTSACLDSGGDDDSGGSTEYYGYFIDSGVEQLSYRSKSFNDDTNPTGGNGQFSYYEGETTTFSFLGLDLGSASPTKTSPIVTPATILGQDRNHTEMTTFLAGRADNEDAQTLTNLLVLLQSFDRDQNPENGIVLPTKFDDAGLDIEYDNLLANVSLSSADFSTQAQDKLQLLNGRETDTLVDEQTAIDHFLGTLEQLEAVTDYIGRWGMRSGAYGDLSAIYKFNEDGSVNLIEYDNCPGSLWGSTEALLKTHCDPVQISQTFNATANGFELISSDFTDTCLPISNNSHESFLTCNFFGSGLGNETIRLQRAPTDFTEAPLAGTYTTIDAGGTITSTSFTEVENGTNTGSDDVTGFNWSFTSDNVLSLSGGITESFTFNGYLKGSWLLGASGVDVIFRHTDNITNANLLNQMGQFYGIFDASPSGTGECKGVAVIDSNYEHATQERLLRFDNTLTVDYACDYPRDWFETPIEEVENEIVTFNATAMTIQGESSNKQCYLLGVDDYQYDTFYVACQNEAQSAFDLEIWKEL